MRNFLSSAGILIGLIVLGSAESTMFLDLLGGLMLILGLDLRYMKAEDDEEA